MTFVLGMRCSDGLVICADTLESDGITKRYRQKLCAVNIGNEWGVCWGSSGSAYTCDKFADKMKQTLRGKDTYNRAALESDIEVCLEFIRQSYSTDQSITVVAGMFGRPTEKTATSETYLGIPEFHLYRGSSESACLSPIRDWCCAGMDVTLAGFVLANTHHPFMPLEHGKRLGIFATSLMKHHAEGVGGATDCFHYQLGSTMFLPMIEREITEIEKRFPISSFDEAVTEYWLDYDENRNLEELTQSHLHHKRAARYIEKVIGNTKSDKDKSEGE